MKIRSLVLPLNVNQVLLQCGNSWFFCSCTNCQ